MMNYIALQFVQYLLSGPMMDRSPGNVTARTPEMAPSAQIPLLFTGTTANGAAGIHWGFILAVLTAMLVDFFLKRTTLASRYAPWAPIRTPRATPV